MAAQTPEAPHWETAGVCGQTDPDLFFPEHMDRRSGSVLAAKRLCQQECEVFNECLEDVLLGNISVWGIKAGMTPKEQREVTNVRVLHG